MRRRRGTFQRPYQEPWWMHPAVLLPLLVSVGSIVAAIAVAMVWEWAR